MKIYTYLFAFLITASLISCGQSADEIFQEDTEEIIAYLEENNLLDDAEISSTGFYYIIDEPGNSSIVPTLNSEVTCNYRGFYPDGEEFDANDNIPFVLGNTIEGWRQGIRLIGEGGSIQLFLPSVLCYGRSGRGDIPANQVLFFEVDLLKVN